MVTQLQIDFKLLHVLSSVVSFLVTRGVTRRVTRRPAQVYAGITRRVPRRQTRQTTTLNNSGIVKVREGSVKPNVKGINSLLI